MVSPLSAGQLWQLEKHLCRLQLSECTHMLTLRGLLSREGRGRVGVGGWGVTLIGWMTE